MNEHYLNTTDVQYIYFLMQFVHYTENQKEWRENLTGKLGLMKLQLIYKKKNKIRRGKGIIKSGKRKLVPRRNPDLRYPTEISDRKLTLLERKLSEVGIPRYCTEWCMILQELVHAFPIFMYCIVSRNNSSSISESPLHFISFLTVYKGMETFFNKCNLNETTKKLQRKMINGRFKTTQRIKK